MAPKSIKNIAIVGAGVMGQGIAQVCATAGYPVMLYDIQPDLTRSAIAAIRKNLEAAVEKGKITSSGKDEALARIQAVGDFRQLQVDLAIEAVIEKREVKQKILSELEKINALDCLLVSNTSSFPITQLGSVLKHKERCAGLHFFNPAPVMKLVEIVKGGATSDLTIKKLSAFVDSISKTHVMAADSPGFIVNRVARFFYTESLKIVEDGVTDFQTVDALLKSTGFKMGPFQLMDLIGVDTNFFVTTSMYDAFYQDRSSGPAGCNNRRLTLAILAEKVVKVFMIILHSKISSRFGFIALCLIAIMACTPNDYDDPIPYAPFPEIILNLNLPQYIALKTTGTTLAVGGGVRGIIIYSRAGGDYAAYERNCSFHPNDACATVNVDASNLFMVDPCCGSTFDLATGMPTGGVAIRPLAQYKTTFDGVILTITDERIE